MADRIQKEGEYIPPSVYTEADIVSFGSYLLSDERNAKVEFKKEVHHADLENWKHAIKNIGNQ